MIDTSKIRPGDTGTIEVEFIHVAHYGVAVCIEGVGHNHYIPVSIIASHTPAPWVPEKGDVVRWNGDRHNEDWTILGTHESRAWIWCSGYHETPHVSDLTLIRKGAA